MKNDRITFHSAIFPARNIPCRPPFPIRFRKPETRRTICDTLFSVLFPCRGEIGPQSRDFLFVKSKTSTLRHDFSQAWQKYAKQTIPNCPPGFGLSFGYTDDGAASNIECRKNRRVKSDPMPSLSLVNFPSLEWGVFTRCTLGFFLQQRLGVVTSSVYEIERP